MEGDQRKDYRVLNYSINSTVTKKKFCLSLHYNGGNSYLAPLCLGNISKDWLIDNMKKTGLTGYVYDFSADYNTVKLMILKTFIII